jgi:UDP-N-acetylglucosamine acyltransferase
VNIHPLAVVSPQACIAGDVTIGPFCIIEGDVVIAEGCRLAGRVVVKDGTRLGPNNQVHEGVVLGGFPQHLKVQEQLGRVVIGACNTIRENATIHRAMRADAATTVGNNNLLMVNAHVAHDCRVGNNVVIANNTMLAGHVMVEDRAFLSGAVGVHQFCRIGRLAMVGGHARIVQDVPPYVTVDGNSGHIVGLNLIGLRRNGFSPQDVLRLKQAYRLIYRSGLKWTEVLEHLKAEFASGPSAEFHTFLSGGTRGFVQERRMPPGATIKLRGHMQADNFDEVEFRTKAG